MIDCVVIVVSYRSATDLPLLLDSLDQGAGRLTWHAVVVDNDGTDGVAELLAGDSRVTVVDAGANLGYSGGLNVGVAKAPAATTTLFLNPDLVVSPGSVSTLFEALDDEHVGAVVPLIRDAEGRRQPSLRREPSILRALGECLFGDRWAGRPGALAEMVRDPGAYEASHPVDWATGAALMVPTSLVAEVGTWDDQRFFLYSEETDYCRRIRMAGRSVVFVPQAQMSHRGAGSGRSAALDALLTVNKVRYFQKWHGDLASFLFAGVTLVNHALRFRDESSRASLRALVSSRARKALPRREAVSRPVKRG
jgi:N-acetylglucosaminyl-diphospho-decaprenol L-rhamnosyltransferase